MSSRVKALRSLLRRRVDAATGSAETDWARFRRQILVVCHGNLCRSPFAAALLEARLPPDTWRVFSAGIGDIAERTVTPRTQRVADEFGVDLSGHRSQPLDADHVRYSGLIFTMSRLQAETVAKVERGAASRIRLLGAFVPMPNLWQLPADPSRGAADDEEISDPISQSSELHRQCFERIDAAVNEAVAWLMRGAVPHGAPATADGWLAPNKPAERRVVVRSG